MYIQSLTIKNYKSFGPAVTVNFTPSFNIVVGQNNAGKTALLEALTLYIASHPHRSMVTVPIARATPLVTSSQTRISFTLDPSEFDYFLRHGMPLNGVAIMIMEDPRPLPAPAPTEEIALKIFNTITSQPLTFTFIFTVSHDKPDGELQIDAAGNSKTQQRSSLAVRYDGDCLRVSPVGNRETHLPAFEQWLVQRVYRFRAERSAIGPNPSGATDEILAPDGSNLATVLNSLQGRTSALSRFKRGVRAVFPDIQDVVVQAVPGSDQRQVLIFSQNITPDRDDLAIPLAESGTGVGQVLCILYVALTSRQPQVILIDEPQSFLHPAALRRLISVLKEYSDHQHQYIITTHSPAIITATDPQMVVLLRRTGTCSTATPIDGRDVRALHLALAEVGARLSDVFGADNILWVEGQTEEKCFPLIVAALGIQPLRGTVILGVVQTGDFQKKDVRHKKLIYEIYTRLSKGAALLPPGVGFIFDREGQSPRTVEDLARQMGGSLAFLDRRMYENYLLHPEAIAALANTLENFPPITATDVQSWLDAHQWERSYFPNSFPSTQTQEDWVKNVDGAKLLDALFGELSGGLYTYDKGKIVYGVQLTQWLLEHDRPVLQEIASLIDRHLQHLAASLT